MDECRPNFTNPQVGTCQKCGVRGYADLLVYCSVCQISAEHVYCLDTKSKVTQKVVEWSCQQCTPLYFHKQLSLRASIVVEERNGNQLRDSPTVGDASQKILPNPPMESDENAYSITDHALRVENLVPNSQLNQQTATDDAEVVKSNSKKSISKQLGKAFVEGETHADVSASNVHYKKIEEHFQNKMRWLKNRFNEFEVIEKVFVEKKSEIRALIAKKVATVDVKEQGMLDRVQDQKDIASAVIVRARNKFIADRVATVKEQAMPDLVQEQKGIGATAIIEARNKLSICAVDCLDRQQCLMKFCEDMDVEGLLNYITENQRYMDAMHDEISVALKSAAEPAHLVLDLLKGFYPSSGPATSPLEESRRVSKDRKCLQRLCLILIESVAPLVLGGDEILDHETKRQAREIADDWKSRLDIGGPTCRNSSLEVMAFLELLTVFRIASEFDEEELCKLVLAVSHRRRVPDLCLSLGLTHKMPDVVETLISRGRQIDAVHFVQAFKLDENFPSVPLLKTYLKDLRSDIQRKNTASRGNTKNDGHRKELDAVKSVIKCIMKYTLEADYPLLPLQKRLKQLEDWKYYNKRACEDLVTNQERKKARVDDGRKYESCTPPLEHASLAYSKRNLSLHRSYRMEPSSPHNSRICT